MSAIQKESGIISESTSHNEEGPDDASWEQYLERKNLVLRFLDSNLSPQHLQQHQHKVELLKKSYFYLEIQPSLVAVRGQNQFLCHIDIFQLINPCQFQRMKNVGKTQVEIQLLLLTDLLEQLERGREELSSYLETWDVVTFLSQWEQMTRKVAKLSEFLEKLLLLQSPGELYMKHQLVSPFEASRRGADLPDISLSFSIRSPPVFDRQESVAHKDWVKLRWFTEDEDSCLEHFELHVKLLTGGNPEEMGYGRLQVVTSTSCIVPRLQPNRSYEFTVRRSDTHTLVYQTWQDSITLKTKGSSAEEEETSTGALQG